MPRQTFRTKSVPQPVAAYSHACRIGKIVSLVGQVRVGPGTGEVVVRGVAARAERTLKNVVNEVSARSFPQDPPARATVLVGLADGLDVEITALAVASG